MGHPATQTEIATAVAMVHTTTAVWPVVVHAYRVKMNASMVKLVTCVAWDTAFGIRLESSNADTKTVTRTGRNASRVKLVPCVVMGPLQMMAQLAAVNAYR